MNEDKCTSWLGHKFEARYDSEFPDQHSKMSNVTAGMLHALRKQTYVKDICVRCGEVVKR